MKRQMKRDGKLLSAWLEYSFSRYALAASAAGVGMLSQAWPAEAKIVYTPTHQQIGYIPYQLDLNHDGTTDFAIETGYSYRSVSSFSTVDVLASGWGHNDGNQIAGTKSGNKWLALAIKQGGRIGPKGAFLPGGFLVQEVEKSQHLTRYGQWINVRNRYLGLSFPIDGKTHYGWARLNVKVNPSYPVFNGVLTGYAYETIPKKAIIAGKTKGAEVRAQAASLGHLARGATATSSGSQVGKQ